MVIPYSEMAGFIISAYKPLYTSLFNKNLVFTFENYVKCQIHMPTLLDLYDRDIYLYFDAYKYLEGDNRYLEACGQVLELFYEDMYSTLVKVIKLTPTIPYKIEAVTEFSNSESFVIRRYDLEDERKKIQAALNLERNEEILLDFTESEIKQLVATDMLCLASILLKHKKSGLAILEVV